MKITDYECVGQCLDGEKCCWDQYTEDVKKMAPTKLYIASKLKHAQRWRDLREVRNKENFEFVCSWIDGGEEEGRPTSYAEMWERYAKEIRDCDVMIVYVEPGEVLKGALVEMGIALGARKAVILCGVADADPFKTLQYHPCVLGRVRHIGSALKLAKDALSPQLQWRAKKVFTFELTPISGRQTLAEWKEINETVSGAKTALRQKVKTDGLNVRLVRVERY